MEKGMQRRKVYATKGCYNAYFLKWKKRFHYVAIECFSLTWPASMQIYWKNRKCLHKKRVQLPEDWFGTPTWPRFYCFGTPIWPPWPHVKTLYIIGLVGWCQKDKKKGMACRNYEQTLRRRVICVYRRLDMPLKIANLPFNIAHCATLLSKQQN